ncbi:MAG: isoprenylcysteine carboxylmethyltransferase family protein [Terracidiphilus sp.]|jgi:protein-S-isoprenylcysteine O-methyltransferase Ste14
MLQIAAVAELLVAFAVFSLVFFKQGLISRRQKKAVRAPASLWGVLLQTIGFAFAWAYLRPDGFSKSASELVVSMILAPLSVALAWAAVRHLGKQWRYEAALSADHELIRTGPYRWIRHPIYASMLGMTLATLAAWTWWPMGIASLVFFLAGTEVRVRAEERLLAERFGAEFADYRKNTRAFIPFLR